MSTTPKYGRLDPGKRRVVHGALVVEQPALRLRRKHHVLLGRHRPKLLLSIELTVPLSNVTVTNLSGKGGMPGQDLRRAEAVEVRLRGRLGLAHDRDHLVAGHVVLHLSEALGQVPAVLLGALLRLLHLVRDGARAGADQRGTTDNKQGAAQDDSRA